MPPFEGEKIEKTAPQETVPDEKEAVFSPEKEKEYRELIDRATESDTYVYFDRMDRSKSALEKELENPDTSFDYKEKLIKAKELYLEFVKEGKPFADFLVKEANKDLETDKQHEFYRKLFIFDQLSFVRSAALIEWLGNEKVWNYGDGSSVSHILDEFPKKLGEKGIPALEKYIKNISQPNYERRKLRENLYDYDVHRAVLTLLKIGGEQGMERLDNLAQENHIFSAWLNTHRPILEGHLEREIPIPFQPQERQPKEPLNYEEEKDFVNFWKKRIERRKEQEEKLRFEPQQILIRGSALLAQMLGKDKKLARDVDVFLVRRPEHERKLAVQEFRNIKEARKLLSRSDYQKLRNWLKKSGYLDKPIHIVDINERYLRDNDVYVGEPELVLRDRELESLKKIYRPLSRQKYEELLEEIEISFLHPVEKSSQKSKLKYGLEINEYLVGKLIRGEVPDILCPNGTLARALRTLDLGERFGMKVDDIIMREAEKQVRDGSMFIRVSPEDIHGKSYVEVEETLLTEEGKRPMDDPFMKVAEKKSQFKRLKRDYPRLGTLVEKIQSDGGIREFILKNYGEVYLKRGGIHIYDVNLAKSPASLVEQEEFLDIWDRYAEESVLFPFRGIGKRNDAAEVPSSKKVQALMKPEFLPRPLKEALDNRVSSHLSKTLGTYEVSVGRATSLGVEEKIKAFLGVYRLCWNDVMERTQGNLTTQLIKLGVHPRSPILKEFQKVEGHTVNLVIADNPEAILGASTDKPWTSCVDIENGAFADSLFEDVRNGSVIAYLLKENKFIGRVLLRATKTTDTAEKGPEGDAAGIEGYYGDRRYGMALIQSLGKILDEKGIRCDKESITLHSFPHAWADMGYKGQGSHILYSKLELSRFRI